ncbi:hypothetical protein NX722_00790 [Endozoicomonas gorgoniicola]|uniref:RING-type domain-containing protein n=1 Tax=Endozoicomonas gorgoniicola TaxID=1234144 RepID=A0ABT3MPA9_9GAMM|nr:RING finger domain-containing protein [Endozoicomonas gorgoniicola]MCW7551215.1 hypothetical protein [Endozoicomonas gorgoniicola]
MGTIENVAPGVVYGGQQECAVCYENYDDHEHKKVVLPCQGQHVFCGRCVNKVLENEKPRCPYCRGDIKSLKPTPSLRERMIKGLSNIPFVAGACAVGACAAVAFNNTDSGYIRSAAGGVIASVGGAVGYNITTVDNPVIQIGAYLVGWTGLIASWAGLITSLGAYSDSDEVLYFYFSGLMASIHSIEMFKQCRRRLHDYMISSERPSP